MWALLGIEALRALVPTLGAYLRSGEAEAANAPQPVCPAPGPVACPVAPACPACPSCEAGAAPWLTVGDAIVIAAHLVAYLCWFCCGRTRRHDERGPAPARTGGGMVVGPVARRALRA